MDSPRGFRRIARCSRPPGPIAARDVGRSGALGARVARIRARFGAVRALLFIGA
jgi:hypothetical protein